MSDKKQEMEVRGAADTKAEGRAQYRTPVITHYGQAAQIVRTLEGVGTDGGHFSSDTLS